MFAKECLSIIALDEGPGMPEKDPYSVSVVVDRFFGDRLVPLTEDGPVWIIDSPENQEAATTCWRKNPNPSHLTGVTIFKGRPATSPEDLFINNLQTIDLHHGEYSAPTPYSILDVFGTRRTPRIEAELAEFGFHHLKDTPDGFQAVRTLAEQDVQASE